LFDENQSAASYKNRVAYVVAHGKTDGLLIVEHSIADQFENLPINGLAIS